MAIEFNLNDPVQFTIGAVKQLIASADPSKAGQIRVRSDGTVFVSNEPEIGNNALDSIALALETFTADGYLGPEAAKDPDWIQEVYSTLRTHWPTGMARLKYIDVFENAPRLTINRLEETNVQLAPTSRPPKLSSTDRKTEAVSAMVSWFHQNFEDPVHSTPHDSREGGYLYIWGGPHSSVEQLADAFERQVPWDWITSAVSEIEHEGTTDWAPSSDRLYDAGATADVWQLHREMQSRAAQLDTSLSEAIEASAQTPGIGHNNAPDSVSIPPLDGALSPEEVSHVRTIIGHFQREGVTGSRDETTAREHVDALRSTANRVRDWILSKAEIVLDSALKTLGGGAAAYLVAKVLGKWNDVMNALYYAANAASAWLQTVSAAF